MPTKRQQTLLDQIKATPGCAMYVCGSDIGVARRLAKAGLLKLTDDGPMVGYRGNEDGERYTAEIESLSQAWADGREAGLRFRAAERNYDAANSIKSQPPPLDLAAPRS